MEKIPSHHYGKNKINHIFVKIKTEYELKL